jgi:hypothetical protein
VRVHPGTAGGLPVCRPDTGGRPRGSARSSDRRPRVCGSSGWPGRAPAWKGGRCARCRSVAGRPARDGPASAAVASVPDHHSQTGFGPAPPGRWSMSGGSTSPRRSGGSRRGPGGDGGHAVSGRRAQRLSWRWSGVSGIERGRPRPSQAARSSMGCGRSSPVAHSLTGTPSTGVPAARRMSALPLDPGEEEDESRAEHNAGEFWMADRSVAL